MAIPPDDLCGGIDEGHPNVSLDTVGPIDTNFPFIWCVLQKYS